MNNRLGFVSATGVVGAAILLVSLLAWTLVAGPVMFSPGSLNSQSKGQTLGGVSNHSQLRDCGACHTAPWSSTTMADKCLACHTDVRTQIQASSGLHGRLVGAQSSPTCRGCHPEHHGPKGALTVGGPDFPHELTGYSLKGHRSSAEGAKVTCTDCHPKGLGRFDQATCVACHTKLDAAFMTRHEAAFGRSCLTCHDGTGAAFDHNKLPFKLTGKHAGVACERCHSSAGSLQGLKKTPQDCYACHAKNDKHGGRFGRQCGQCHSPDSWTDAKFDHSSFPIDHGSEERRPTCQTCHPKDVSTYTCYGCHEHTPATVMARHQGRTLAALADCVRCHAGGEKGGD